MTVLVFDTVKRYYNCIIISNLPKSADLLPSAVRKWNHDFLAGNQFEQNDLLGPTMQDSQKML